VSIKAAVNTSVSSLDVRTENLAVVAACIVQLSVVVVVIGLELSDTQQLLLTLLT